MRAAWMHNTHTLFLISCLLLYTQSVSVHLEQTSVTAPLQGSALFSVSVSGSAVVRWSFSSAQLQHLPVAVWILGGAANVSQMYAGRVQTHRNGSLTLTRLRLQDSGCYRLTVTEENGGSRDAELMLSVREVLYEDTQFLLVFVLVLGTLAVLLMLCVWLLNKLHSFITAWRSSRCSAEHSETELQPL
ncbi:V-set and transmembrane domain-containing protein 5 isoform X2 [Danio aesculapii]|uniref:V-set and transmembrane domain-containing protein 5 isoform X1 n=1 Tax=Danio aesculapii TaxID=1142201 RepID=UPI0024C0364B|nr:V-set and transmembrane domain-containing protein 5 isoform X1 [Danio aesculapii]XP_056330112.1 V-set and transmembrane domain-containing protein 5 isoform X2 [Danio aesculapii]